MKKIFLVLVLIFALMQPAFAGWPFAGGGPFNNGNGSTATGGGSGTITGIVTTAPLSGGVNIGTATISIGTASASALGVVQGDGSTITISGAGVESCTTATTGQIGCSKPDGTTITISGGVISAVAGGGSGTVASSTIGQVPVYTGATTVTGNTNFTYAAGGVTLGSSTAFLSLGTSASTNIINLLGTAAQTIGMVPGTSVGNNLTISAGNGLTGGTDEVGGTAILQGGIPTGTQTSNVQLVMYGAAASSTGTGTSANKQIVLDTVKRFASATTQNNVMLYPTTTHGAPDLAISVDPNQNASLQMLVGGNGASITGTNAGQLYLAATSGQNVFLGNNGTSGFTEQVSTSSVGIGTTSTASSLNVSGNVGIGATSNATAAPTNGLLVQTFVKMAGLLSGGTKFTTSGCSVSATTGGATAGTFTVGANTCTTVVTMNGATGLSATNGWSCAAADQTAPLIVIAQSASNATTASFSVPATAGSTDVIVFHCIAY